VVKKNCQYQLSRKWGKERIILWLINNILLFSSGVSKNTTTVIIPVSTHDVGLHSSDTCIMIQVDQNVYTYGSLLVNWPLNQVNKWVFK